MPKIQLIISRIVANQLLYACIIERLYPPFIILAYAEQIKWSGYSQLSLLSPRLYPNLWRMSGETGNEYTGKFRTLKIFSHCQLYCKFICDAESLYFYKISIEELIFNYHTRGFQHHPYRLGKLH